MSRIVIYTCATLDDALDRIAELRSADYRIDIFESGVDESIADFRSTGAGGVSCHGDHWIIAGVKPTSPDDRR